MAERRYLTINCFSRLDTCTTEFLELRNLSLPIKEYGKRYRQIRGISQLSVNFLEFIAQYKDGLFHPERCDVYEPIREEFDPSDLATPASWLSVPSGRVMLKKRRPFYYEGFIENRRHPRLWVDDDQEPLPLSPDPIFLTELCLWIDIKVLKVLSAETVIEFFIDFFLQLKGEYGFLSAEEDHRRKNYLKIPDDVGITRGFRGDNLEKCLPGVYWVNIFGGVYVDFLGKEKLTATPCFRHRELPDGSHFIQTAESVWYYRDADGEEKDRRIIEHLGSDAFFDRNDLEKVCRVPRFKRK